MDLLGVAGRYLLRRWGYLSQSLIRHFRTRGRRVGKMRGSPLIDPFVDLAIGPAGEQYMVNKDK
jgi:hypothetical protein